ncbi:MAG: hypothetical protein PHI68_00935 [Candidatus Cloacimonetes bacterium]|nr:hypothetical protein [Candidatus Cloacimonadota bacterium]
MKIFVVTALCLMISVAACAGNKPKANPPQQNPTPQIMPNETKPFDAPAWLWEIPSGDYTIGIAYDDGLFGEGAEDVAREYAAVSLSRNKAAYVVDKSVIYSLAEQSEIDWTKVNFQVVVSADTSFLYHADRELKLIDKYSYHGYLITLHGLRTTTPTSTRMPMSQKEIPAWCTPGLVEKGKNILAVGASHQVELMDAWMLAQEEALREIARYKIQNVVSKVRSTENLHEKSMAAETVYRNANVQFDRAFILYLKKNQSRSYKVFLQLKAECL